MLQCRDSGRFRLLLVLRTAERDLLLSNTARQVAKQMLWLSNFCLSPLVLACHKQSESVPRRGLLSDHDREYDHHDWHCLWHHPGPIQLFSMVGDSEFNLKFELEEVRH